MWTKYIFPSSLDELVDILDSNHDKARIIAGATDLLLEFEKGIRNEVDTLVDISRISGLDTIRMDEKGFIHIGPLVTYNQVVASPLLRKYAFPLVNAAWQVGAPQIRNRGTIVGNLVTASPANDTIPPLLALGAELTLTSRKGIRHIQISEFYTGVRKTVLNSDEVVTEITFPAMNADQKGTFLKLGLRRAQAISLVSTALVLQIESDTIKSAFITLGAVAPTVIHAPEAEEFLVGKTLVNDVIEHAADLASMLSHPITDIRGSAEYRKAMVKILVRRGLLQLKDGTFLDAFPERPVLLSRDDSRRSITGKTEFPAPIHTRINGLEYTFSGGYEKNLLHLIRENAGLTGTKEGCGEGECGACTIHLNGQAVMACLIPAPCADGAEITTIEGLSTESIDRNKDHKQQLHPVQQAFIDYGAVQCGYCTPGFIMAASKLVDEFPHPTREQVTQGLTGNLCRCTGYYRIIEAVEQAVKP